MNAYRLGVAALVSLIAACASGPRPMSQSASPDDRLERAEEALLTAKNLTGSFEVSATGAKTALLKGALVLQGGNALKLVADGTYEKDTVHVELDSTSGMANRSLSKGPSASNHHEPVGEALAEALLVKLVRLGLVHDLARLSSDEAPDSVSGGVKQWARATATKDAGSKKVGDEPCHAVSYTLEIGGQVAGTGEVCISDATSLPLTRSATVHFGTGDLSATESYRWTIK